MMIGHEACERLANDETHVERQAGILSHRPTRAFQGHDVIRLAHHDVARCGVGDDLLQVPQVDLCIQGDQSLGRLCRDDLAMIPIGEAPLRVLGIPSRRPQKKPRQYIDDRSQSLRKLALSCSQTDVQIRPAAVHIAVKEVQERIPGRSPPLTPECAGRGPHQSAPLLVAHKAPQKEDDSDSLPGGVGDGKASGMRMWRCRTQQEFPGTRRETGGRQQNGGN